MKATFTARVCSEPRVFDSRESDKKDILFNVAVNEVKRKDDGTYEDRATYISCKHRFSGNPEKVQARLSKGSVVTLEGDLYPHLTKSGNAELCMFAFSFKSYGQCRVDKAESNESATNSIPESTDTQYDKELPF